MILADLVRGAVLVPIALLAIAATGLLTRRMVGRKVLASCLACGRLAPISAARVDELAARCSGGNADRRCRDRRDHRSRHRSLPGVRAGGSARSCDGVVFLAQVGSKAVGLILIAPLYAVFEPSSIFAAGGVLLFVLALAASLAVGSATRRARVAEAIG